MGQSAEQAIQDRWRKSKAFYDFAPGLYFLLICLTLEMPTALPKGRKKKKVTLLEWETNLMCREQEKQKQTKKKKLCRSWDEILIKRLRVSWHDSSLQPKWCTQCS